MFLGHRLDGDNSEKLWVILAMDTPQPETDPPVWGQEGKEAAADHRAE